MIAFNLLHMLNFFPLQQINTNTFFLLQTLNLSLSPIKPILLNFLSHCNRSCLFFRKHCFQLINFISQTTFDFFFLFYLHPHFLNFLHWRCEFLLLNDLLKLFINSVLVTRLLISFSSNPQNPPFLLLSFVTNVSFNSIQMKNTFLSFFLHLLQQQLMHHNLMLFIALSSFLCTFSIN